MLHLKIYITVSLLENNIIRIKIRDKGIGIENVQKAMEESLKKAVSMGAEVACFGDIDIEGNRKWAEERAKNANLKAVFPLWHKAWE